MLGAVALVASVTAACAPMPEACVGFAPKPLPEFMFGSAATDISGDAMRAAARIGYRWIRVPIRWNQLQPTVATKPTLTLAELDARPELVDEFAATADWSTPDAALRTANDLGLQVVGFVGASSPPTLNGAPLDPSTLGNERYLAQQSLVARAIVRRYGSARIGAPADVDTIRVWQTENELNIAPAASLIGWRTPGGFEGFTSSPWSSFDFLTGLLRTLRNAVVQTDPAAVTVVNISTDSPAPFNVPFGRPDWPDVVSRWRTLADVIAIDTYPNYYLSTPVDGTQVGADLAVVAERVCPSQQVMVMETGYPNGPTARGYDAAKQAEFLEQAWRSSDAAGAAGFMPFSITSGDPANGTIPPGDQALLDQLGRALGSGDLGSLAELFLQHPDFVSERLAAETQLVEGQWGVLGPDGEALPGLAVVRRIAAETAGR